MHKHLKTAIKFAKAHEFDEGLEYYLCAIIVRGGNIISVGFNKHNTNGFVEHYADQVKGSGRDYCLSTHAEMSAVTLARAKTDLTGCKIFVVRLRAPGAQETVGLARPCNICQNVLYAYGIKRAYYTIDDNNYGVMTITKHNNDTTGDKVIEWENKKKKS